MKILLKAGALSEWVDGANCFLFDLDDKLTKELLARRELFQMGCVKDSDLEALAFGGVPGEFYDVDEDALLEYLGELAGQFDTNGYVVVDGAFTLSELAFAELAGEEEEEEETGAVRTELEQTFITKCGVYFRAGLAHASTYVESFFLPFEVLLKK